MLDPPRRALPTRAGVFALAAPIVLGSAAVSATNNLLFMLLAGTLGSIVLSGILSERNLSGIRARVRSLGPVRAGEAARLAVDLERESRGTTSAYDLRIRERIPLLTDLFRLFFPKKKSAGLDVILPELEGERGSVVGERCFQRRGWGTLGRVELLTSYPFGLLNKARDVETEVKVLVRPRRVPVPPALSDPRGVAAVDDGAARRGVGVEILGLRERQEWDPANRVHALRSLALGRDVVFDMAGLDRPSAWIGIANAPGASEGALERAIEIAAATIEAWTEAGYSVGLVTSGQRRSAEDASTDELLDLLAVLEAEAPADSPPPPAFWLVPDGAEAPASASSTARISSDGRLRLRGRGAPA